MEKKSLIPGYLSVALVWFAIHIGPGTASGRQIAVYYVEYGKWALVGPFLAMGLLGICIYVALEIARLTKSINFRDFANNLFHPYEKIFSNIFEFTFLAVVGMSGGACVYTGAYLFEIYFGLPVWFGMVVIALTTIFFSIYGAELVRASSSYMSIIMFVTMMVIVVLGLAAIGGPGNAIAQTSFDLGTPGIVGWNAMVYAAFQSVGVIGSVVAVSDALRNKMDSKKTAIAGVFINAVFLVIVSIMMLGYPKSINETLPNYYIIEQLGYRFLVFVYAVLLFFACVTNTIGFSHALSFRYSKHFNMNSQLLKSLIICIIMLVYVNSISFFGLDAIVRTGFAYLGYSCLVTLILPLLVYGPFRLKKLKANAGEM
jgi:uncharacterized membrane protein YkvI